MPLPGNAMTPLGSRLSSSSLWRNSAARPCRCQSGLHTIWCTSLRSAQCAAIFSTPESPPCTRTMSPYFARTLSRLRYTASGALTSLPPVMATSAPSGRCALVSRTPRLSGRGAVGAGGGFAQLLDRLQRQDPGARPATDLGPRTVGLDGNDVAASQRSVSFDDVALVIETASDEVNKIGARVAARWECGLHGALLLREVGQERLKRPSPRARTAAQLPAETLVYSARESSDVKLDREYAGSERITWSRHPSVRVSAETSKVRANSFIIARRE